MSRTYEYRRWLDDEGNAVAGVDVFTDIPVNWNDLFAKAQRLVGRKLSGKYRSTKMSLPHDG